MTTKAWYIPTIPLDQPTTSLRHLLCINSPFKLRRRLGFVPTSHFSLSIDKIHYNFLQHNIPNQKKKKRHATCIQQFTRFPLMSMSVGREFETRHPFIFFHVLCFHFCVFLFFYLHAHGGSVPCWYVCLYSSVHACC